MVSKPGCHEPLFFFLKRGGLIWFKPQIPGLKRPFCFNFPSSWDNRYGATAFSSEIFSSESWVRLRVFAKKTGLWVSEQSEEDSPWLCMAPPKWLMAGWSRRGKLVSYHSSFWSTLSAAANLGQQTPGSSSLDWDLHDWQSWVLNFRLVAASSVFLLFWGF